MAPKKVKEEPKEEPPKEEEDEEAEPAEPEIMKRCFRAGGQLYYGDCKAGYKERKGMFIRHGFGRQVDLAASPAGSVFTHNMAWETVVLGVYEGNWTEDTISGQGTYKWSDGSSYDGNFVEGVPTGHGRFVWPDGSVYEGAWQNAIMSGQGRLDSRFDGRFHQGKFSRNCFQTANGKWIDILEKTRLQEEKKVLEGEGEASSNLPPVHRCAVGQLLSKEESSKQKEALVKLLGKVLSGCLVPFVLAETSVRGSALDVLEATGFVEPAQHTVSLRLAAIARRRRRDYHRFFFDAIQCTLRSGNYFAMAFEDDEEGCALLREEQPDWYRRKPGAEVPTAELPEDWGLAGFFEHVAFPIHTLQPTLFNGRFLSRFFLPEVAEALAQLLPLLTSTASAAVGPIPPVAALTGAASVATPVVEGGKGVAPAAAEVPAATAEGGAAAEAPPQLPERSAAARRVTTRAAEGVPSGGAVGQTTWFWEDGGEVTPQEAGLPMAPMLRPVVLAQGRMPEGLTDEDLQMAVLKRFGRHVPLHCTAIVLLTTLEPPETPA